MNNVIRRLAGGILAHATVLAGALFIGGYASAVEWFDDFSDGNADSPPVQWTPSFVFAGDYEATSGDYILRPTDDPSQPTGTDDENLLSTVDEFSFTDVSVRTRAVVGFGETPRTDENADFDVSGLVDGADLITWQRFVDTGTVFPDEGDANFDSIADGLDLEIWEQQFGTFPAAFRGGNVGVVARFNPATGNGYVLLMDDGNQWNLLASEQFGTTLVQINDQEGENVPPVDPDTGETINAETDLMIQLDVTGQGDEKLLEVWFWRPGEPMPPEPFFSRVDDFSGVALDEGVAGVIYNEDQDNTPGIFRFVQASDVHLGDSGISTAPEPSSLICILIIASGFSLERVLKIALLVRSSGFAAGQGGRSRRIH